VLEPDQLIVIAQEQVNENLVAILPMAQTNGKHTSVRRTGLCTWEYPTEAAQNDE
jgi:hypothetical protein